MLQATAQSPMQEITEAETAAASRIEDAKRLGIEEVESFKAEEEKHLEEQKASRKEKARSELTAEKEGLGSILKKGKEETDRQMKVLKGKCEKNKVGIVSDLVEKFLSLR